MSADAKEVSELLDITTSSEWIYQVVDLKKRFGCLEQRVKLNTKLGLVYAPGGVIRSLKLTGSSWNAEGAVNLQFQIKLDNQTHSNVLHSKLKSADLLCYHGINSEDGAIIYHPHQATYSFELSQQCLVQLFQILNEIELIPEHAIRFICKNICAYSDRDCNKIISAINAAPSSKSIQENEQAKEQPSALILTQKKLEEKKPKQEGKTSSADVADKVYPLDKP